MILRKPYAFFIKIFKPLHLVVAALLTYLIYLNNKILSFLTNYLHSSENIIGQKIKEELINNFIYIIPIIIIVISLLILGIMFKKKKPITFYFVNVFVFIAVIIINLYASNFLGVLEESIVALKSVKLIQDLVLINVIIEILFLILYIVRGLGINLKKFDFQSELSKIDISESDKEEIEVSINFDFNESKRKRKKALRSLKYFYYENKFIFNLTIGLSLLVIGIVTYFIVVNVSDIKKEGTIHSIDELQFGVNSTMILDTDYRGKKITNNYLIVVNCKMRKNSDEKKVYLKDFSLKVGENIFKSTTKYSNSLIDLGLSYEENKLTKKYENYLFVYELPKKYITSEMLFMYNNLGNTINIKLNPKNVIKKDAKQSKKIGEELTIRGNFGEIVFRIDSYDIKNKYPIEYNFCIKDDYCIKSKEYLKASIDENFDKYIIKLDVKYNQKGNLGLDSFYSFFSKFGSIDYNINGNWYSQQANFEEIKSKKKSEKNVSYIGIDSKISTASNIKIVFDIRGAKYEYIIK